MVNEITHQSVLHKLKVHSHHRTQVFGEEKFLHMCKQWILGLLPGSGYEATSFGVMDMKKLGATINVASQQYMHRLTNSMSHVHNALL